MKNKLSHRKERREHPPQIGVGIFLITLGIALLIATNDLLGLGSVREYFTWETALVFIGFLLLFNLEFTGGLIMIAIGAWFFIDDHDYELPELVKTIYWPSLIILIGLGFILSSFIKRISKNN